MLTVPVSIWAAMRRPFATSRVQTDALSPNSESLASATASVSSATSRIATTGPERLLAAQPHVLGDAGEHRRLVEERSDVGPGAAAGEHRRALGDRVVDVRRDPLELGRGDQRTHVGPVVERGAELESP